MISVQDIRINNIVIDEDGKYGRINSIIYNSSQMQPYWATLDTQRSKIGKPLCNYKPIELTPEILEAAGFTNGIKIIETSFLETEFYVDLMDGDAGFNKHGLWFPCKYLHQLQNLFWCLCGKELVIDLQKL